MITIKDVSLKAPYKTDVWQMRNQVLYFDKRTGNLKNTITEPIQAVILKFKQYFNYTDLSLEEALDQMDNQPQTDLTTLLDEEVTTTLPPQTTVLVTTTEATTLPVTTETTTEAPVTTEAPQTTVQTTKHTTTKRPKVTTTKAVTTTTAPSEA